MILITIAATLYLSYIGFEYYNLPLEERFYHEKHHWFKPSGTFGHGLGIAGTVMMLIGVLIYILRKRYNFLARYIRLKHLLEFHIFLCVLGPILIVFHTAFKIGGIVSIAFWCMIAVVASGVIGRFIYIQIPRTIEGRELGVAELKEMQENATSSINKSKDFDQSSLIEKRLLREKFQGSYLAKYFFDRKQFRQLKSELRKSKVDKTMRKELVEMFKKETILLNRIERLQTMQNLFKYWHVAHLPFAVIMLVIVVVHVIVSLAFGYKWIF